MKTKVFLAVAVLTVVPVILMAQGKDYRGGFEINGGMSMASLVPGENITNTGAGAEALLHYRITNTLGIYAGWGYNMFRDNYQPVRHVCDFEETGYLFGVQLKRPVDSSRVSLFVRGGLQYKHIEIEDPTGEIIFDTTHGLGWNFGLGLECPLGDKWSVIPEFRFNALPEVKDFSTTYPISDINYFSVRIGIAKNF
jgi:hypothetical protein